jgi:5-amino-6-(5-phosphoribosylamino)uracil reductase
VARPHVVINVAATLDGKIDTFERRGAAISSAGDRARVDELRASVDAIMVGSRTLLGEDPRLVVRSAELRAQRVARGWPENPAKIGIISRLSELKLDARFLTTGPARIIIFTAGQAVSDPSPQPSPRAGRGRTDTARKGHNDPPADAADAADAAGASGGNRALGAGGAGDGQRVLGAGGAGDGQRALGAGGAGDGQRALGAGGAGDGQRAIGAVAAGVSHQATEVLLRARGVEVFVSGTPRVDLAAAMAQLFELGLRSVLVEGGGSLNFDLLRAGLVDEVQVYVAPLIFGGASAPTLADGNGLPRERAVQLIRTAVEPDAYGGVLLRYKVEAS